MPGNLIPFSSPYKSTFNTALSDSDGGINQAGNYSVIPGVFTLAPAANETFVITSLLWSLTATGLFKYNGYASSNSSLTNGVLYERSLNGEVVVSITFNENDNFSSYSSEFNLTSYDANAQNLRVGYDFTRLDKYGGVLYGKDGDFLKVTIRDDLSYFYDQTVTAAGYVI